MTLPNPPFQTGIQDVSTDRVRPTWQQWIIRLLNQVNGLTGTTTNPVAGDGTGGFREITLGDGLSFVNGVLSASSNAAVYGQFFDDTTQALAVANVSQLVRINSNSIEQGCFLQSSGRVVFEQPGTFNVQYSIQLSNSATQLYDAVVWFAKNAESIPASSTMVTVPNSHGGTNGHNCLVCNLFITVAAGDFVELYWSGQNTALSLETVPELTIDNMPSSPAIILTVSGV